MKKKILLLGALTLFLTTASLASDQKKKEKTPSLIGNAKGDDTFNRFCALCGTNPTAPAESVRALYKKICDRKKEREERAERDLCTILYVMKLGKKTPTKTINSKQNEKGKTKNKKKSPKELWKEFRNNAKPGAKVEKYTVFENLPGNNSRPKKKERKAPKRKRRRRKNQANHY